MAFSLTRLTLFAIISSIEDDLRSLAEENLSAQIDIEQFFSDDIYGKCYERYLKEYQIGNDTPNFRTILLFSDLGDLIQSLNTYSNLLPRTLADYLSKVTITLNRLIPIRNRLMHSRPLNFDDLPTTIDIAEKLSRSKNPIWQNLDETLLRLQEEPSFVLNLEVPSYFYESAKDKFNLPIPDFDETGFIGREQQVKDLIKYCLGPYPVTTIVGEGGVGKSALALRVAYDILDLTNSPFDAIVWTTSKTAQLTPNEIVKIEGAITSSLGILESAAEQVSGIKSVDPIKEILDYMKEFKILLIIDNLETVLDDRIKSFLGQLPGGSKVLITSRIGLGAYEIPVKLVPFEINESIQLIRALAKMRQVSKLVQMPNRELEKYCKQLQNNPGFIKWFVSAVQAGKRPEEILANPETFLEFCLSNVYEYLTTDSKKIVKSIICMPRPHTQSELAYLNDITVMDLQKAIQQLLTTNIIAMNMHPSGSSFETTYSISELAKEYITRLHPVSAEDFEYFKSRNRQLISAGEQISGEERLNPYSFFNIRRASSAELVIGKYLRDAVMASKQKEFRRAYELVDQAKSLAPSFFEVYRVKAQVQFFDNNYIGARENYETAIELEPNNPQVRFWYGQFLLRAFEDLDGALLQLNEALKVDPDSHELHSEIARVLVYKLQFEEARKLIDQQLLRTDVSVWGLKKIHDLNMQFYERLAEYQLNHNDPYDALLNYEKVRSAFENCPVEVIDIKMYKKLQFMIPDVQNCKRLFEAEKKTELRERCSNLESWLLNIFGNQQTNESGKKRGTVTKILSDTHGVLCSDDGETLLFRKGGFRNSMDWKNLRVGSRLSFEIRMSTKGKYAALIVAI